MKRRAGIAAALLLVVALAGCASDESPDPDAVDEWLQQQTDADTPGGLASFSGRGSESGGDPDEGIRVGFEEPVSVTGADFSCFGAETMSVEIEVAGASRAISTRTDDLLCSDSPHQLPAEMEDVGSVRGTGYGSTEGAWSLVVRGTDPARG
jgi:hypothetical protein